MEELETTRQYLTVRMGAEVFAFDVANVREIVEYTPVTQLPQSPEWIRGVVNLRGSVVPVVDLKRKFGMGQTERTVDTCIVVIELDGEKQRVVLGALVDGVQEVFEMEASELEAPPEMGEQVSTEFIRGMGRRNGQLFIVLDAERVFSWAELGAVERVERLAVPEAA